MDTLTIFSLVIASIISTACLAKSSPLIADTFQMGEEEEEQSLAEIIEPDQQEQIVTFLALLDKAEKSANARFAARITGVRGNTRLVGKKNRMEDMREEISNPSVHQEESTDHIDELTEYSPIGGKHFRKAVQNTPRKKKKRACFWKYCIQTSK
ncbi:prepro-urotensin II-related peptide [Pelobates cultripes]|uniref:Prepro-urotensin II-related peptide n=1 Tax=Pelobates cultripes TaxID=61616 RepID=A0AAD1VK53_PELCU|nr:prepro-urotensin II-related peptide [Pelobates cultripes]